MDRPSVVRKRSVCANVEKNRTDARLTRSKSNQGIKVNKNSAVKVPSTASPKNRKDGLKQGGSRSRRNKEMIVGRGDENVGHFRQVCRHILALLQEQFPVEDECSFLGQIVDFKALGDGGSFDVNSLEFGAIVLSSSVDSRTPGSARSEQKVIGIRPMATQEEGELSTWRRVVYPDNQVCRAYNDNNVYHQCLERATTADLVPSSELENNEWIWLPCQQQQQPMIRSDQRCGTEQPLHHYEAAKTSRSLNNDKRIHVYGVDSLSSAAVLQTLPIVDDCRATAALTDSDVLGLPACRTDDAYGSTTQRDLPTHLACCSSLSKRGETTYAVGPTTTSLSASSFASPLRHSLNCCFWQEDRLSRRAACGEEKMDAASTTVDEKDRVDLERWRRVEEKGERAADPFNYDYCCCYEGDGRSDAKMSSQSYINSDLSAIDSLFDPMDSMSYAENSTVCPTFHPIMQGDKLDVYESYFERYYFPDRELC